MNVNDGRLWSCSGSHVARVVVSVSANVNVNVNVSIYIAHRQADPPDALGAPVPCEQNVFIGA